MSQKITIRNRWTDAVLFECDAPEGLESGVHMRHALEKAVEAGANLAGANLAGAYLAGAYLARANLADANLARAYLAGAKLAGANLARAYLARANLADANLAGAYLARANLAGAYLARANLADAYLAGANLADAYLAGANLAGANLADANLAGANLAGAKLAGAKLRDDLTLVGKRPVLFFGPIGSCSRTVYAWITDQGLRIQAGCFFGTREEFVDQLSDTHGDNEHAQEYTAALVLIDAHVKLWTPAEVAA